MFQTFFTNIVVMVLFRIFCTSSQLHRVRYRIPASSPSRLTVLQRGSSHLCGRGPCPSAVAGLHHDSILSELLQVVQHQAFCIVPCGLHADHTELVVSTRAVLPVAHLVAPDGSILEVLLGRLAKKWQGLFETMAMNVPALFQLSAKFPHFTRQIFFCSLLEMTPIC